MDQRHLSPKTSITKIAAEIENDWQETARKLAQAHGGSIKTVHTTLHKHLKVCKKSARRLPGRRNKQIKKEWVGSCEASIVMISPWFFHHLQHCSHCGGVE